MIMTRLQQNSVSFVFKHYLNMYAVIDITLKTAKAKVSFTMYRPMYGVDLHS